MRFLSIVLACLLILSLGAIQAEAKTSAKSPQVHVVKDGDSLYEIAKRHGLSVNELKRLNGLNSSRLKIGQKLALTRAAAPPLARAEKAGTRQTGKTAAQKSTAGSKSYVVKRGDSLHTIASRHRLTVDQLKRFNGLSSSRLKIGQQLVLSGSSGVGASTAKRASRPAADTHVVKKGESLYTIARRHGMAVEDLKRINDLSSNRLKIGQRLALASQDPTPSPLLLPGDSAEDEVVQMATTAGNELEQVAFDYLSTPYRFGGSSRKGIDCSAFVQTVFREVDVKLPRSAREQFRVGEKVESDDLRPGDLLFFRTYAKFPSHVGIYLGDRKMIHASSRSRRVVVTDIDEPYYRKRFIGAKRITLLDDQEPELAGLSSAVGDEVAALPPDEVEDPAAPVESTELVRTVERDLTETALPAGKASQAPQAADQTDVPAAPDAAADPVKTSDQDLARLTAPAQQTESIAPVVTPAPAMN